MSHPGFKKDLGGPLAVKGWDMTPEWEAGVHHYPGIKNKASSRAVKAAYKIARSGNYYLQAASLGALERIKFKIKVGQCYYEIPQNIAVQILAKIGHILEPRKKDCALNDSDYGVCIRTGTYLGKLFRADRKRPLVVFSLKSWKKLKEIAGSA